MGPSIPDSAARPPGQRGWFPRLFDAGAGQALIARWLFLRALAAIYFSAFLALLFQIRGLIGPRGILPAAQYLAALGRLPGGTGYWYAPTLFWLGSGNRMLLAVTAAGLLASLLALLNVWPRLSLAVCLVSFLSFVAAAQDFSAYQSDGMLLEAGFLALFFSPPGLLPGWGRAHPPSRASLLLLRWEWFRIYFESGLVKLLSGDPEWRHFTAMDEYYQNSPLPTWVGWYVQHLPHWFHAGTVALTLAIELAVVLLVLLPGRARLVCFLVVTPWELGVILTGNYAFLNYLVLALGVLLLDDRYLAGWIPRRWRPQPPAPPAHPARGPRRRLALLPQAALLGWVALATAGQLAGMLLGPLPLLAAVARPLEPFRIANRYGLFAVMTRGRYEIEFEGSNDRRSWRPYLFRFKPQRLEEAPRIYAPYQPRLDWNLWFASLGSWRQNDLVPLTEERLLEQDADVLRLFAGNPFPSAPPRYVRALLWQYWFTSPGEKRATGNWWRRRLLGLYAPVVTLATDGHMVAVEIPGELPPND